MSQPNKYGSIIEEENKDLRQQLLSSQAAIEAHNKDDQFSPNCYHIRIDLSLLREHDAEIRKPLVEALEYANIQLQEPIQVHNLENIRKIIGSALAQCKEVK